MLDFNFVIAYCILRISAKSVTNLFVGIQPINRIKRFFPTKPSEVQTIFNGRGNITDSAICKSKKHE